MRLRLAALAGLLLLAACDDGPKRPAQPAPAAAEAARATAARQAAEERLRARLRIEGPLTLRATQVYRQAMGEVLAVCGQINGSGRLDEPFIPYVAVVGFEGERPARAELHLAASSAEAARVYFEMVDRCWEGGGPANARAIARPMPPMPSGLPRSAPDPVAAPGPTQPSATQPNTVQPSASPPVLPPPPPPQPMAGAGAAIGAAVTTARHPVNIRANPSGGGEVVRIVPRSSQLQVFAEAAGGWLQVGEAGEVYGWVHSSLLESRW